MAFCLSTVCIVELGTSTDTVERHQEEILKKSVDACVRKQH